MSYLGVAERMLPIEQRRLERMPLFGRIRQFLQQIWVSRRATRDRDGYSPVDALDLVSRESGGPCSRSTSSIVPEAAARHL